MSEDAILQFDPLTGRKDDVRVTLTDLSYRQTSKGPRYPYGDFGSDFIDSLHCAPGAVTPSDALIDAFKAPGFKPG